MKNFRRITTVFVFLAVAAGLATADQISFSANTDPALTAAYPAFSYTLTVQAFDPSLGTLNSVEVIATGDFLITETAFNGSGYDDINGDAPLTEAYNNEISTGTVQVTGPANLSIFASATTAANANLSGVDAYETDSYTAPEVSGSNSATFTDPTSLSAYTYDSSNPSTLDVSLIFSGASINTNGTALSGNDLYFGGYGQAGGGVEVIYNFTDAVAPSTPEPASVFLMGSALVGAGFLRRRLKS